MAPHAHARGGGAMREAARDEIGAVGAGQRAGLAHSRWRRRTHERGTARTCAGWGMEGGVPEATLALTVRGVPEGVTAGGGAFSTGNEGAGRGGGDSEHCGFVGPLGILVTN